METSNVLYHVFFEVCEISPETDTVVEVKFATPPTGTLTQDIFCLGKKLGCKVLYGIDENEGGVDIRSFRFVVRDRLHPKDLLKELTAFLKSNYGFTYFYFKRGIYRTSLRGDTIESIFH